MPSRATAPTAGSLRKQAGGHRRPDGGGRPGSGVGIRPSRSRRGARGTEAVRSAAGPRDSAPQSRSYNNGSKVPGDQGSRAVNADTEASQVFRRSHRLVVCRVLRRSGAVARRRHGSLPLLGGFRAGNRRVHRSPRRPLPAQGPASRARSRVWPRSATSLSRFRSTCSGPVSTIASSTTSTCHRWISP